MSRKFKKLVRSVSEKAGVSHAGAVNLLRRGNSASLKALDPVLVRSGAKPLFGKHTHEAGIVSAVFPDGDVIITPAEPRNTRGGVSFSRHEDVVRYKAEDVRPYRLKKGERFARFVEDVFDLVLVVDDSCWGLSNSRCSQPQLLDRQQILLKTIVEKGPDKTAYVIGEEGESITAVMKPMRVIIPLWRVASDLIQDGEIVGQDAVRNLWAVRDRMLALIDCSSFDHDLLSPGSAGGPRGRQINLSSPPDGTEWYVLNIDDDLSKDRGMLTSAPPSRPAFRYACGKGKVGRHVSGPAFAGLYLCEGEVSVVSP